MTDARNERLSHPTLGSQFNHFLINSFYQFKIHLIYFASIDNSPYAKSADEEADLLNFN